MSPVRSLFAPVRSWLALPKPGLLTNPFTAIKLGGAETAQVTTFLKHDAQHAMGDQPGSAAVHLLDCRCAARWHPSSGQRHLVGGFSLVDGLGLFDAQPQIPGIRDVRVS